MTYLKITLFFLIANSGCAQEYQSQAELENEILGTWYYENYPLSKITFSEDGTVKRHSEEELQSTNAYEITNICEGEELRDNQSFLKETYKNGSTSCAYIEAINLTDGFLTMMTKSQGKIIVLKRKI